MFFVLADDRPRNRRTCRYAGYRDDATFDGDFLELHLRPLTDAEAEQFVKNWFELVETTYAPDLDAAKKKARQDAEKLVAKLRIARLNEWISDTP